jgi:hypothetical protein
VDDGLIAESRLCTSLHILMIPVVGARWIIHHAVVHAKVCRMSVSLVLFVIRKLRTLPLTNVWSSEIPVVQDCFPTGTERNQTHEGR